MSIPGMQSFYPYYSPKPAPVLSNFVVVSPEGVRHTGPWPTRESAFGFSASLGFHRGEASVIEARIQPVEPYTFEF